MHIIDYLQQYEAVKSLYRSRKTLVLNDEMTEALVITSAFKLHQKTLVIVKPNLYSAQKLYERVSGFLNEDECLFYPSDESFRMEALATSPELLTQRIYVLNRLLDQQPRVIIMHTASLIRNVATKENILHHILTLQVGQTFSKQELVQRLEYLGYHQTHYIEKSLQYSQRGGVVDFFGVNYEQPLRIEYFGDEIDSIRFFDLNSQRTIKSVEKVDIFTASDLVLNYEDLLQREAELKQIFPPEEMEALFQFDNYALLYKYYAKLGYPTTSILSYIDNARVLLMNESEINENYQLVSRETFEYLEESNQSDFCVYQDLKQTLNLATSTLKVIDFKTRESDIELPLRTMDIVLGSGKRIQQVIQEQLGQGYKIVFALENEKQIEYLLNLNQEWGFVFEKIETLSLPTHALSYVLFPLKEGFELIDEKIIYYGAKEVFGISAFSKTHYTRYKNSIGLNSHEELDIGDFVVHDMHGVGQFLGIETKEVDEINRDYLKIAYRRGDVLFVPLEHFRLVRKFVSKDGIVPKLNKLGSEEWTKTKRKIKSRIKDIAERLLSLYTSRAKAHKEPCVADDEWQIQFEASFPYELTSDQKRSVQEIKQDMENTYPMDRLLCGDVGYGKTEVAFIAAFKAIMSEKQVAILCPTTLLARQHYERALERFADFPINIGIVSRFTSAKDTTRYLKMLAKGELHLLIGTHRLFSKDIQFKNLGLLVVDEEQRFGVEHKEKIKELKENIDVLTLSATPIPRTLQMALVGIRSLSQIDTPPINRMPIQTYVIEKNQKMVKEIIQRELARNGQVFYLHNRIYDLSSVALKISQAIPGSNVIVVHGQMNKEEIEDAMIRFVNKEANVMVATTIIENGIDIPNANTIIIDDADRFGLSQLYQIKGRVGRGDRLAYAYLMYGQRKQLSEVAYKRLKAIKEFAELGSGYRIALRDLSIRGAGDILGAEQAGFIDTVGMDMYIHLLQEAIEEQRTGIETPAIETSRPMHINAYVPQEFTTHSLDKIDLYKQIDEVKSADELATFEEKIKDIFGRLPTSVKLLLEKRRLELSLKNVNIEDIIDSKTSYEIVFHEDLTKVDGIGLYLFSYATKLAPKDIDLVLRRNRIRMKFFKKNEQWLSHAQNMLQQIQLYIQKN